MAEATEDKWAEWLLHRRFGGDPERRKEMLELLYPVRDRVLRDARLAEGETLLDVGTGDGLIGFGALAQTRGSCKVIFSDISDTLLERCRVIACEMGVLAQSRFLETAADSIALDNASVDVITTRSVLIYIKAKQQAFHEFFRVLKPGGRISLHEPINRYFGYPDADNTFMGYDVTQVAEIARKVKSVYHSIQPPADPMLDFDERDLLEFARNAGFGEIHLELQAHVKTTSSRRNWDHLLQMSGNPKIPTLQEAMEEALTPEEIDHFTAYLRPLVENGQGTEQGAVAYLWAVKD